MNARITRRDVLRGAAATAAAAAAPAALAAPAEASAVRAGNPAAAGPRQVIDLAGTWEFGTDGATYPYRVPVPNFLASVSWWLYTPADFPEEQQRIASYGYDPDLTEGWYQRTVAIPASFSGQRVELQFDGIAMYSEISVNGTLVESSWGMWRTHRLDVTALVQAGQPATIGVYVKMDTAADHYSHGEFAGLGRTVTSAALGIWESVRLVATAPVLAEDVFFRPRTDGADIDVTIANTTPSAAALQIRHVAVPAGGGRTLFEHVTLVSVAAGATATVTASVSGVQPRLWSPDRPALYVLTTTVERGSEVLDNVVSRVGFRTFEVRGNAFYLNGKPYWLRGAGHLPTMMVGQQKLGQMRQWLGLLRGDNVRVARMHMGPAPSPWFDLTDEMGMGLNVEGMRPWAFAGQPAPAEIYVQDWQDGMTDVIRRLRNHPSVLIWTTGNELGQYDIPTWTVLSDINTAMRAADPTRPIVADAEYVRDPATYTSTLAPAGIDDGDVDDAHIYPGWYQPSAFVMDVEDANGRWLPNTDRPFIAGELGTGYPNFHTGRPWDVYLTTLQTPQAWVGAHAADADPAIFLDTHALLTKELAEMLRRTRDHYRGTAGFVLFSSATWFRDFYSSPHIEPFPVNDGLRLAYQAVLVSLDDFSRHFYAGEQFQTQVAVVNDDIEHGDYGPMRLTWQILDADGHRMASGGPVGLPAVPYHDSASAAVTIAMPKKLPAERMAATLHLAVTHGGRTVSQNRYDIVLATRGYVAAGQAGQVWLYDPAGATQPSLDAVGLSYTAVTDLAGLAPGTPDLLVIGKDGVDDLVLAADLDGYADAGGRVVILEGGTRTAELFPADLDAIMAVEGEVVTPVDDDAVVFAGMHPMDMRWWRHDDGSKAYVTYAAPQFDQWNAVNVARLAIYTAPNWPSATPTFDQRSGYPVFLKKTRPDAAGYLAVSGLTTSTSATVDPLAGKVLANLLGDLSAVPLDPPPPTWDGFTEGFENGLGAWTVDKGTLVTSSSQAHSGTQSLTKASTGTGVIYREARPAQGIVTLWFYDDASVTSTALVARADNGFETGNFRGIGVYFAISQDRYLCRIDGAWTITSIARTTGWHQFGWDYTSGTGVTMSIDGQDVATASGLTEFSVIALGDYWGVATTFGTQFIDDISVTVTS